MFREVEPQKQMRATCYPDAGTDESAAGLERFGPSSCTRFREPWKVKGIIQSNNRSAIASEGHRPRTENALTDRMLLGSPPK